MINNLKGPIQTFLIASLYYLFAFLLFCLLIHFTGEDKLFNEAGLLNWDAEHYKWIKENGYEGFRVAFFPLFPLIWKTTSLGVSGIIALNAVLYIVSFTLLSTLLQLKLKHTLLLLSIPSIIFMFLPYSEAVFYVAAAILLLGLYRNKIALVSLGILLCCIARPVSMVLVPAIIITEFLTNENNVEFIKRSLIYTFFAVLGLFVVFSIQYYYTGEWLAFFEAQKGWDNHLRLPTLPLISWAGGNITRLDGSALLIGIIAFLILIKWFADYIKNHKINVQKELLFSTLYLTGISLLVLLYRGGVLFSLNRFIYATPFFAICLFYFLKNSKWSYKHIGLFILGATLFWFLFGSWGHIQTFLKFGLLTLYLATYLFMTMKNKLLNNIAFYTCLVCNVSLQVFFYHRFLTGEWVG